MWLGKTVLFVCAVAFVGYGLISLFSPAIPAGFAGLVMSNGDAFAEVGAMYGGLQTGLGLFCALAFRQAAFFRSGLWVLVFTIGPLALARLGSLLVSVEPVSAYTYGALVYELATTVLAATALLTSRSGEARP